MIISLAGIAIATPFQNGSFEEGTLGTAGYGSNYYYITSSPRTGWTFTGIGDSRWLINNAGGASDGNFYLSPAFANGTYVLEQTFDVVDRYCE